MKTFATKNNLIIEDDEERLKMAPCMNEKP